MKKLSSLSMAVITILALCGSVFAQQVQTDYDRHADFSRYHTYYWTKVHTEDPLWESRVTDAVDKELQSKGWQKVQSDGDVALAAVGASKTQQEYRTFYDGLGGWRWGGFGNETTTTVENYQVGTLVVDMFDNSSKRLIWRGMASDTLSNKVSKNENRLEKAVDKMFKDFPPRSKG
jgi:hypothetical protein